MDTSLSSWQAAACPHSGLDRKRGTGSWNQEVRRHATLWTPLRAQRCMTNLVSSDRTRSVSYTALSPCAGGQIKATLIHNGEALLNPENALIKIETALRRGENEHVKRRRNRGRKRLRKWHLMSSNSTIINSIRIILLLIIINNYTDILLILFE